MAAGTAAASASPGAVAPPATAPSGVARRLRTWIGIFSAYFSTQTVAQLLGILAGLVFIRTMPLREYALYALANSVLTFFSFATDLGSTTSLVHFFHRSHTSGDDFAGYLAAVVSLRRRAFLGGAAVVAVALPSVAMAKGFPPLEVSLATVAVIVAVGFQIVSVIRVLVLRLQGHYGRSYRADLASASLRLLLALAMVAAAWLRAWLAVLTAAAGSLLSAWLARDPIGSHGVAASAADVRPYRRTVLRYMLPTLPSALYFSIQGPLVVWLAATFGATRNIAEVAAITRLGLLVGIFSGLTGIVFLPRLARITDDRLYRLRTLQFGSLHLALACTLLLAAWVAPTPFLWLLGPHYAGLHRELLLVVAASGLTLLGGYLVGINLARCWTRWEVAAVAVLASFQACAVIALPMSTTSGVLTFNVASAAVGLALQLMVVTIGFTRPRWVQWNLAPSSLAS